MKAKDQLYCLQELLGAEHLMLDFGIAKGCRCMGCWVYTFLNTDGEVVLEEDTLEELIEAGVKHFNIQV